MKKENKKIEIVFLLDRSGSMGGLENDTIGGYNSFIKDHKNSNANLTTILFDNNIELLHDRVEIKKVKPITNKDYYVRGSTALMDAIGFGINKISSEAKDSKVIFVITTDGMENSSREYTKKTIKKLIEKRKDWEFMYLGANIDSYDEASQIGIKKNRTSNYTASGKGTKKMYEALSGAVCCLERCEDLDANWNKGLEN